MSADEAKSPAPPLMAHLESPAGLSDEWKNVFGALRGPVLVVTAFYSHPDAHLLPLALISTALLDLTIRSGG